ncbi:MAG: MFS transporter [Microgenomates group bacterium GW2011_GWC1_44_10]|uniref:Major facilitator superfamily n=1 Tax=Candidatus Woesebacteria bacterium GW2011_GWA2_44_33 TaxID=1618564 RepID=A0A0G1LFP4_9BACT|nr:MAG: MFS transporter [Microgenomates group bacterium GW2011_GWC1_44_10]KKT67502.1 MAG: Major facilitator superfamily [Candidatus Woesebacteria bacterium GW2011_GWA2_44_33]
MEKKKGISLNVVILGIVSFLNDVASEMVYPVVPIFLMSVLGAPALIVGFIEGLADSVSKILMAFSGILSDRSQKRKPYVVWGYSFATFSHLIMATAGSWPVVMLGRIINRTGKGIRTSARDALITESSDKVSRGRNFGFHRTLDSLGAVVGPLLSIIVLKMLNGNYRNLFLIAFFPALLGVLLFTFFIKEKEKQPLGIKGLRFEWSKANDSFKIFLLISFIFTLGNSSDVFMILRAQNLGLSIGLTIFTYVLFNSIYALLSLPAGIIADKIGARKILFIGFLLFALVYFSFGYIDSPFWIWILFPIYGIYMALTDGVGKAYISKLIPHEISASAFGIYQTLMGVGTFFASTLAGALWTFAGVRSTFYFGGVMALVAAFLFLILTKRVRIAQPIA